MSRILIVCGARVLDASPSARRWAKTELASAVISFAPDVVAHGDARGPDRWTDDLAGWLYLPRVVFPCFRKEIDRPVLRVGARVRWARDADRFRYDPKNPKESDGAVMGRNQALMKWGEAQRNAGHVVQVLAFYAPWTATKGTAHAVGLARGHDLAVTELTASPDLMPDTDDCTGREE